MGEVEVNCIACGNKIEIDENNSKERLVKCWDGWYVICPNCHRAISIEQYWNRGCVNS